MKASTLIANISSLMTEHGDCEVTVTDGFNAYCYRQNDYYDYDVTAYKDVASQQPMIDIGIGGCMEDI